MSVHDQNTPQLPMAVTGPAQLSSTQGSTDEQALLEDLHRYLGFPPRPLPRLPRKEREWLMGRLEEFANLDDRESELERFFSSYPEFAPVRVRDVGDHNTVWEPQPDGDEYPISWPRVVPWQPDLYRLFRAFRDILRWAWTHGSDFAVGMLLGIHPRASSILRGELRWWEGPAELVEGVKALLRMLLGIHLRGELPTDAPSWWEGFAVGMLLGIHLRGELPTDAPSWWEGPERGLESELVEGVKALQGAYHIDLHPDAWSPDSSKYQPDTPFRRAVYLLFRQSWRAKQCPVCGRYFVADKPRQRYCGSRCYGAAKRRRDLHYWRTVGTRRRQQRLRKQARGLRRKRRSKR
jgi:hypothetical protein